MNQSSEYPKKGKSRKEGSNNNGKEKQKTESDEGNEKKKIITKHKVLSHYKGVHSLSNKQDKRKKIYRFSLYAYIFLCNLSKIRGLLVTKNAQVYCEATQLSNIRCSLPYCCPSGWVQVTAGPSNLAFCASSPNSLDAIS